MMKKKLHNWLSRHKQRRSIILIVMQIEKKTNQPIDQVCVCVCLWKPNRQIFFSFFSDDDDDDEAKRKQAKRE